MGKRTKEQLKSDRMLESQIKELLSGVIDLKHDKAVLKGLLLVNTFQTYEELQDRMTIEDNGYGFNSVDGTIATSYCEQLSTRYFLTPKQMVIARKIMKKYWKQLFNISRDGIKNEKINHIIDEWELRNRNNYSSLQFVS